MENKIDHLLQFITERFSDIHFEIIHNSLSPTLKHFIVRDSNGEKGFGTDHNYCIAIEKAYSEFIERKTFQELHRIYGGFKSSNGFAAHINPKNARESSINELIERDAFLLTWHSKIAPYWMTEAEVKLVLFAENLYIIQKHKNLGLKLSLGIIATHGNLRTCITKVEGILNGKKIFYIDTKTGSDFNKILNALVESISYYTHFITLKPFSKKTLNLKKVNQPIDHFFYYLGFTEDITWFHKSSSKVIEIPKSEVNTYVFTPDNILDIKKLKRTVSFSESNSMQNYYCGPFKINKVNTSRFQQIFGANINYNKQLHPLS